MSAHLHVWHRLERSTKGHKMHVWYYRVLDGNGRVMASDNSCGGDMMLAQGLRDLAAFHRLERIGHSTEDLRSYGELMDGARRP